MSAEIGKGKRAADHTLLDDGMVELVDVGGLDILTPVAFEGCKAVSYTKANRRMSAMQLKRMRGTNFVIASRMGSSAHFGDQH